MVHNYKLGKRWVFLFVAVAVIGGWIINEPMSFNIPWAPKPILGLVAPEYYAELVMEGSERCLRGGIRYDEPLRTESLVATAAAAREERVSGAFLLLFAGPPLYWLFAPGGRGIRIDRRRQVIYGWSWGALYAFRPKDPELRDLEAFFGNAGPVVVRDFMRGPLILAPPRRKTPR